MEGKWYRPWYIWLSVPAFIGVFGFYGFKQMFFKRPFDLNTWIFFCLHSVGLFFLTVMLPSLLMSIIFGLTSGFVYEALSGVEVVYLYLSGVFMTAHLSHWARKHL